MTITDTSTEEWVNDLFALVAKGAADKLAERLAPDAVLVFGNSDPVSGRDTIRQSSFEFRATLAGLEHQMVRAQPRIRLSG